MEQAWTWLGANWPWVLTCALLAARIWWLERRIIENNHFLGPRFRRLERTVIGLVYAHDDPAMHAEFVKHKWDHRIAPDEATVRQAREEADEFRAKALGADY